MGRLPGIYMIRNATSGKLYIGSSCDLLRRLKGHQDNLVNGCHGNAHLQNAWSKCGGDAFSFTILFLCDPVDLMLFEQRAIDWYKNLGDSCALYNIDLVAGSRIGHIVSEETRRKQSIAMKGRPGPNLGRVFPAEVRSRISIAHTGKKHSEESCRKMSEAHKLCPPPSLETRLKLSAASRGRLVSPATRQKISATLKGKPLTVETKRKMSEAHKRRHQEGK